MNYQLNSLRLQPHNSNSRVVCPAVLRNSSNAMRGHQLRGKSSICSSSADPAIIVTFIEEGSEGISIECPSGEQLRATMLENKVDVYTTWGKIWQCGGGGQCGTCIVQVVEGADLLSERTATENKKLNRKPETWRLACQTFAGDGTNSGTVVIQTKPQK